MRAQRQLPPPRSFASEISLDFDEIKASTDDHSEEIRALLPAHTEVVREGIQINGLNPIIMTEGTITEVAQRVENKNEHVKQAQSNYEPSKINSYSPSLTPHYMAIYTENTVHQLLTRQTRLLPSQWSSRTSPYYGDQRSTAI